MPFLFIIIMHNTLACDYPLLIYSQGIVRRHFCLFSKEEINHAETDQFAPGPRQRPEDWQQGKSAGRKPIPSIINKAEVQKALTAISRMKHHEWRSLLDRARKNYQLFPDDGNDPDKLNLVMALQYMDEHPTQVSLDERVPAKIIKLKDLLK